MRNSRRALMLLIATLVVSSGLVAAAQRASRPAKSVPTSTPRSAATVTPPAPKDPFIGVWNLSAQKSKYEVGGAPLSFTRTYEDRGGGTIPYHLRIQKVGAGGSFSGHVEDNPGVAGNWAYDVDGQMSGVAIEFVMTRSLRGQFKAVKAQGIVSGERIIANVTQVATGELKKGRSTTGLIILQLAK